MVRRGLTLIELLVVVVTIGFLVGLLLPVFTGAREKGRQIRCLMNLHQLGQAFKMYAGDYDERFPFRPTDLMGHPGGAGVGTRWPPPAIPPWTAQSEIYGGSKRFLVCPSTRRDWSWPLWAGRWGTILRDGPWSAFCGFRGYGSAVGRPEWDVFTSYGYNEAISNDFSGSTALALFQNPSHFVLAGDSETAWFTPWGVGRIWGLSPSGIVLRLAFPEAFPPPKETDPAAEGATRHQGGSQILFVDGHGKKVFWSNLRRRSFGGIWRFHPDDEKG